VYERARRSFPAIAALTAAVGACSYPSFQFTARTSAATHPATTTTAAGGASTTGAGGHGGASSTTTDSTSTTSSTSSSTTHSTTSAGGAGGAGGAPPSCALDHLVVSELRTRGPAGATDEFVELYNPTDQDVVLDDTWVVDARSWSAGDYGQRWAGAGEVLPAHHHYLIGGAGFVDEVADAYLGSFGIADGGSLRLTHGAEIVDVLCYYFDGPSLTALDDVASPYDCEGTPISNLPHDNSNAGQSNSDASLERKPGGAEGSCQDTDSSLADFETISPAHPENLESPPVP
jgi:hypothetical protein